jgi:hypothetical protein
MNFRKSELTNGKLFPLHRPSSVVGMPERCSPARIRFAALSRVLACSAPFRQNSTCDGRLRREHLSDSGSYQWLTRKMLTAPAFSWKWRVIQVVTQTPTRIGEYYATLRLEAAKIARQRRGEAQITLTCAALKNSWVI